MAQVNKIELLQWFLKDGCSFRKRDAIELADRALICGSFKLWNFLCEKYEIYEIDIKSAKEMLEDQKISSETVLKFLHKMKDMPNQLIPDSRNRSRTSRNVLDEIYEKTASHHSGLVPLLWIKEQR